ncbi:MAG: NCS2 family permease [Desulfovibrionaceae bacterium]
MGAIARYFDFAGNKTSLGRESVAGLTTFVTMAYIIIVNPKILEAAGIPFGPSMVATILSACFGTLFMGLYAKKPIAIAPYMGENAFIAYTVCGLLGYSWQTALGAIFISGVLFTCITLLGVRKWLATSIPKSLKMGFVMGIGLFLTFIGLMNTGIVVKPAVGPVPVSLGAVSDPAVLLAVGGFVLMAVLMAWKVPGAILIGIAAVTAVAWGTGVAPLPGEVLAAPPSLEPTLLAMDVGGALTWGFFSVILTVLVMDFVDTMGTLYAVGHQAGLLDENGDMPDIEKPMLADALATIVAALLGTTSAGAYIESATGIESGGRTGFTSVVTGLLFLLALFLSPLFIAIPVCAYGPSLIIVGMLMMSSVSRLDFGHVSETLPCFLTVILMSFSYNLGIGMTAGFLAYPIMKVLTGRTREINAGMWFLAALSLVFYVFYPH